MISKGLPKSTGLVLYSKIRSDWGPHITFTSRAVRANTSGGSTPVVSAMGIYCQPRENRGSTELAQFGAVRRNPLTLWGGLWRRGCSTKLAHF